MGVEIKNKQINISGFQEGMSSSILGGFPYMAGVDIDKLPGTAMVEVTGKEHAVANDISARTFTANAGTDVITYSGTDLQKRNQGGSSSATNIPVKLSTTDTLPAGLAADTIYFLSDVDTNQAKVCTSIDNAESGTGINITDAGTGTHTMTIVFPVEIKAWTESDKGTIVADDDSNIWLLDTWQLLPGNAEGSVEAIVAWKDYLFCFGLNDIDVMDISTSAKLDDPVGQSAWTNEWESIGNPTNDRRALVTSNGKITFINSNSEIGTIEEDTTFDPANDATYTITTNALDLPFSTDNNKKPISLAEMNFNLYIGTKGKSIYVWDQVSTSYTKEILAEDIVNFMLPVNNLLYIFSGNEGRILYTDGVNVKKFAEIPTTVTEHWDYDNFSFENAIYFRNRILFTVSYNSDKDSAIGSRAIFSLDPNTGVMVIKDVEIFTSGSSSYSLIILEDEAGYYHAFQDADNSDVDTTKYFAFDSFTLFKSDSSSIIETAMMTIGEPWNRETTKKITINCIDKLTLSEEVSLYYRKTMEDGWTLIRTFDNDDFTETAYTMDWAEELVNVQFRIVLKAHTILNTNAYLIKLKSINIDLE